MKKSEIINQQLQLVPTAKFYVNKFGSLIMTQGGVTCEEWAKGTFVNNL